jgi:hypothetical protein
MQTVILIAVAISHLATTGMLIREIERTRQLRQHVERLKQANRRLVNTWNPIRKEPSL